MRLVHRTRLDVECRTVARERVLLRSREAARGRHPRPARRQLDDRLHLVCGRLRQRAGAYGGWRVRPALCRRALPRRGCYRSHDRRPRLRRRELAGTAPRSSSCSTSSSSVRAPCPCLRSATMCCHGGARFSGPAPIDAPTLQYLQALVPLAPARQSRCLPADPGHCRGLARAAAGGMLRDGLPPRRAGGRADPPAPAVDQQARHPSLWLRRPCVRVRRRGPAAGRRARIPRGKPSSCTSAAGRACARSMAGAALQ